MTAAVAVVERRSVGALGQAPTVTPDSIFRYEAPVAPETMRLWQRELDRVFEPQERISRLVLRWESGDLWQPIQRLIIWQCEDPNCIAVPDIVRPGLKGPHPRSTGHYCAPGFCLCPLKRNAWRNGANRFMDRASYELWKDTGLWGRRWWVIQGSNGGHRFHLSPDEYEARLRVMMGLSQNTPDPGDLPYAPFDSRVLDKIASLDKLKSWTKAIDYATRHPDVMDAEHVAEVRQAREGLWRYLDDGIDEAWDEGGKAFKQTLRDTYGRGKPWESASTLDYESVHQRFIEKPFDSPLDEA